jgi:hypothetical protein
MNIQPEMTALAMLLVVTAIPKPHVMLIGNPK